jgi:hypothetical protein
MTAAHRVVGRSGWKPRHLPIEDGVWKVGPSLGGDRPRSVVGLPFDIVRRSFTQNNQIK